MTYQQAQARIDDENMTDSLTISLRLDLLLHVFFVFVNMHLLCMFSLGSIITINNVCN